MAISEPNDPSETFRRGPGSASGRLENVVVAHLDNGASMAAVQGGVGEHSATVRELVCESLEFLGIRLGSERNAAHARVVSGDASAVTVRVVPTDEDPMVARHTRRLIEQEY